MLLASLGLATLWRLGTWLLPVVMAGLLAGCALPLLGHPELALDKDIAVQIMFEGMLKGASSFGDFTGKCLEMYFNKDTDDSLYARRIINGIDCAEKIASHYRNFHSALS